ncbi:MAG: class I SAM-dependent DNA methyltransferase [Oscillospiraceae bacterium]
MSGYGDFAQAYDALTFNVPYDEIAEYYSGIIKGLTKGKRLLDMGCGTGNLTVRLAKAGFKVIGQDASEDMLMFAAQKSSKVQWICQSMTETDVGEQVDVIVSTLDSVNHLQTRSDIAECFRLASQNLKTDGIFVFDVNTEYKHREILGNNTFVYDVDGVYCVWQNEYSPEENRVSIELDLFFEEEDGAYTRGFEEFSEIALPQSDYLSMLENAGFEIAAVYEYLTHSQPNEKSEKLLIAARKK